MPAFLQAAAKPKPAAASTALKPLRGQDSAHLTLSAAGVRCIGVPDVLVMERPADRPVLVVDDGHSDIAEGIAGGLGECAVILRFAGQRVPKHELGRKVVELADASEAALEKGLAQVTAKYGMPGGFVSVLGHDVDAQRGASRLRLLVRANATQARWRNKTCGTRWRPSTCSPRSPGRRSRAAGARL